MTVLVCGGREWVDPVPIRQRLAQLPKGSVVIHGAARGADQLAGKIAKGLGLSVVPVPADWLQYGRPAGVIRNRKMLGMRPDLVIAFHADLMGRSKGTKDCVTEAGRRGIPTEVHVG